jgi:multicomponent Na+:H+ antiporter subunit G
MNIFFDVASAVCLVLGALLAVLGAAGVVRLSHPLSAMHAATKPATLGVVLCGVGALLQVDDVGAISKVVVIVALQLVTAPIGAHMLSRAISQGEKSDPGQPPVGGSNE